MRIKTKNFLFILMMFYVMFPFVFASGHLLQDIFVLGLYLAIIVLNYRLFSERIEIFSPKNILILLLFILMSCISIAYPILLGTHDLSYFRGIYFTSFQLIISHLALSVVYIRLYKEDATFDRLIKFYIKASVLYFSLTLVLVLIPQLREFWINVLYISEADINHLSKPQYYTRIGIDGFAGFRHTLRFSIAFALNSYLIIKSKQTDKPLSIFYYLSLVILIIGTLLYGRIGSVASFLILAVLLIYFLLYPKTINLGISIVGLGLLVASGVVILAIISDPIRTWFQWAFEAVISLIQTGEFSSTSTDILFEEMYFVPGIKEFIMGTGYYTDPVTGGYFGSTDVGFLRSTLFFGIFLTAINYFAPIYVLVLIKNNLLKKNDSSAKMLFLFLFILFIIFEIKGGIYHYLFPYVLPLYIVTEYKKERYQFRSERVPLLNI